MHDSRLGRFFAIDPLASDYSWNSSYAFSENRVIDGMELEGLEWILKIYSPSLSSRFASAYTANDLYQMRVITQYARTHHFKSDYGLASLGLTKDSPAAVLYYDKDAHDGVSVEVHKWENNSANSGKIISDGIFHFPTTEDSANPRDAKYPVDVKNGSGFYDEHDFVGAGAMETEAEMIARGGSATIGSGYIKGFGYFEYMSIGKGWSLSIGAGGDSELSNTGNFYGKSPNFASLENFAGKGNKYGLDIDLVFGSAGYSEWHSADFSWQGSTLTYGGGLGLGLYEDQATYTTISFPRTDNYHIDYENWVENFIPLDESSRVGSW